MIHRSSRRRAAKLSGPFSLAVLAAGCLIIPHPVPPDVERIEDVRLADDALVSAGPRRLLESISEKLVKQNPELSVVDPIAFRDAAFPEGGWQLRALLKPGRCRHLADALDVRFLVLVGAGAAQAGDETGIMMPMGLPAGAMTVSEVSVLSAVLFDLEREEAVCQLRSQAEGTGVMLVWVLAVAATAPMTGRAAEKGLANAIGRALLEEGGRGPLRIAVMAAEASGDPFVAYEGAPVSVGRDVAVAEMVNRLTNAEEDVVIGATRRDDIQRSLGKPIASHRKLRVDVHRLMAVAPRETRPLVAGGSARWAARPERSYAGYLLVSYDRAGKVADAGSAFVAAPPVSPDAAAAYQYSFGSSADVAITGFQLSVRYAEQGPHEVLHTTPDRVVIFENESTERAGR